MKYSDIVLPQTVTAVHGYHSVCCKSFLAVPGAYSKKFKEQKTSSEPSTASTAGKLFRHIFVNHLKIILHQMYQFNYFINILNIIREYVDECHQSRDR